MTGEGRWQTGVTDAELLEKIAELTGKPFLTRSMLVSIHRREIDFHMSAIYHISTL